MALEWWAQKIQEVGDYFQKWAELFSKWFSLEGILTDISSNDLTVKKQLC